MSAGKRRPPSQQTHTRRGEIRVLDSIDTIQEALAGELYFADRAMATTLFLALKLGKPLFLEGEAGVGKTEVAKVMANLLSTRLIRLQCYEGLDANHALYEWNYAKQMLRIKLEEGRHVSREEVERTIFSEEYLIKRPLLEAITAPGKPPVLLIDEVDRADEEFEAFLLEVLSDFQITIPEIGTIKAKEPPFVVLTSNRTREVHDALKRRCLYLWIGYPSFEREYRIVLAKVPGITERLAEQICRFMQLVREMDFYKRPGIAETLDWATALLSLHAEHLDRDLVAESLGTILKYNDDMQKLEGNQIDELLERIGIGRLEQQMGMEPPRSVPNPSDPAHPGRQPAPGADGQRGGVLPSPEESLG
ncbi:MAG: MoxR family ATPase, partial [Chloroflexi bacterium]|nr:MoxR family ATPase [Chloroflexota bacterium]